MLCTKLFQTTAYGTTSAHNLLATARENVGTNKINEKKKIQPARLPSASVLLVFATNVKQQKATGSATRHPAGRVDRQPRVTREHTGRKKKKTADTKAGQKRPRILLTRGRSWAALLRGAGRPRRICGHHTQHGIARAAAAAAAACSSSGSTTACVV